MLYNRFLIDYSPNHHTTTSIHSRLVPKIRSFLHTRHTYTHGTHRSKWFLAIWFQIVIGNHFVSICLIAHIISLIGRNSNYCVPITRIIYTQKAERVRKMRKQTKRNKQPNNSIKVKPIFRQLKNRYYFFYLIVFYTNRMYHAMQQRPDPTVRLRHFFLPHLLLSLCSYRLLNCCVQLCVFFFSSSD